MHLLFELSGVIPPRDMEKDASFLGSFRASAPVRTLDPAARSIMTGPQRAVNRAQTLVDRAGAALGRGADRFTSGLVPDAGSMDFSLAPSTATRASTRAPASPTPTPGPSVSLKSSPAATQAGDGMSANAPQVSMTRRGGAAPASAAGTSPDVAGTAQRGELSAAGSTPPDPSVSGRGAVVGPQYRTRAQRASDWAWNNPKSTAALMGLGGVAVPAAGYGAYQALKPEDPWYTQAFNRLTGR